MFTNTFNYKSHWKLLITNIYNVKGSDTTMHPPILPRYMFNVLNNIPKRLINYERFTTNDIKPIIIFMILLHTFRGSYVYDLIFLPYRLLKWRNYPPPYFTYNHARVHFQCYDRSDEIINFTLNDFFLFCFNLTWFSKFPIVTSPSFTWRKTYHNDHEAWGSMTNFRLILSIIITQRFIGVTKEFQNGKKLLRIKKKLILGFSPFWKF